MKKFLLVLLVPFSAFAVELHPEQECESFKSLLLDDLSQYYTFSANLRSHSNRIFSYTNFLRNHNDFDVGGSDYSALQNIDSNASEVYRISTVISNQTDYLSGVVSNVVCSACPADSSGDSSCCEDAIALLESISQDTASILALVDSSSHLLDEISDDVSRLYSLLYISMGDITNQLAYADFLLEHGFIDITNLLSYVKYPNVQNLSLNKTGLQNALGLKLSTAGFLVSGLAINSASASSRDNGWLPSLWWQNLDQLKVLGSLNNFEYFKYLYFNDPVTNNLISLHDSSTNYFSFFRGELGVQGVLADWQSEQVSGSYHDFLTNHYLSVVRGGSLSGNQSTKTNWFARIETLLAALVFTDSQETNTVDTSAGNRERQQLSTSYETANQAAATFSEHFKTTSQSIVSLYRSYFNTFETASMPSHVVLMRLSNSDPSEEVEISFQSDSLGILVNSCRVVTTLCWSSVGIFLLYKFLVWSARCVIVACQFIYRAISSAFKS